MVTNYREGGLQNGRGWEVKFYPYEKGGGAEQVLGEFFRGSLKF